MSFLKFLGSKTKDSAKYNSVILDSERDSSITSNGDYPSFCELAATNEEVFNTFRTNPIYMRILEHVSQSLGQRYLDVVLSRNQLSLEDFKKISANDLRGGGGII